MPRVYLKPGHVQPVWAGHPWIYAQAVARVEGGAQPGEEVEVVDARGNLLGVGLYSPRSAIPVRLYARESGARLDAALIAARIRRAIERRRALALPRDDTDAFRLLHAEGDDLPGLIVDRYADALVVQFGTVGMKRRDGAVFDALTRELAPRAIIDRTSPRVAEREGFDASSGVVRGALDALEFVERGLRYRVPLELGQKTGFYLDQRPLRARVEELARGRRVLDTFTYIGALAMAAARGGAVEVEAVDASAPALGVAVDCAARNGLSGKIRFEPGDAHEALARVGRRGGVELVIVDPPKLAPTRAARARAAGAMRRLAREGCRATRPGGLLVLCSCSAAVGLDELTRALALGGRDAGTRPVVLERHFQGPDHPVPAAFPEGLYLTSLIAEVAPL
ncbi:MAG: class I SAM-dependent rRNA methyltransferase [Sorangiineae bacterium]|nr:class I SAM-dependent rRNA methyltransferase [Polyangiaceae bacterium]MEB2325008.1 class I SAM-dependent rRNA methyltransferase [Sorangiineae bacterium]